MSVLEELGYVRRDADPKDARASTLAVTARGHDTLERLREEGTVMLTESLQLLTAAQRAALGAALPALEALAEPETPLPRLARPLQARSSPGIAPVPVRTAAK